MEAQQLEEGRWGGRVTSEEEGWAASSRSAVQCSSCVEGHEVCVFLMWTWCHAYDMSVGFVSPGLKLQLLVVLSGGDSLVKCTVCEFVWLFQWTRLIQSTMCPIRIWRQLLLYILVQSEDIKHRIYQNHSSLLSFNHSHLFIWSMNSNFLCIGLSSVWLHNWDVVGWGPPGVDSLAGRVE